MSGYMNSPSGYLNPVAVDKVQHPDYDAKAAENTVMRTIQYLYPVIHNTCQMLEELCKHTEVQVPTDLQDNLDILKNISTMQIDWHPRSMLGEDAADELNSRMALHEEWSKQDGNEHHSITNWNNPYDNGQLAQAPPQTQMPPMYAQQPMQQPQQMAPKPTEKATQWAKNNPWFGDEEHKDMTALAYGVHEKLVKNHGFDPDSEEYFQEIDRTMRAKFPEYFGEEDGQQVQTPSPSRRSSTVVAPASRNNGAKPRKVKLTQTQVNLAKRLGLTNEQYAKQLIQEELR